MDHASEGNSLKKVEQQEKRTWAHKDFYRAELPRQLNFYVREKEKNLYFI